MAISSWIVSKVPVEVAGLLLGVRPMGDWSLSMTLSMESKPASESCAD